MIAALGGDSGLGVAARVMVSFSAGSVSTRSSAALVAPVYLQATSGTGWWPALAAVEHFRHVPLPAWSRRKSSAPVRCLLGRRPGALRQPYHRCRRHACQPVGTRLKLSLARIKCTHRVGQPDGKFVDGNRFNPAVSA